MTRTTRLTGLVLTLGSAAFVASGCGNGFAHRPVDDIVTTAQEATAAATAVHATGQVERKDHAYQIDLHLARTGACRGTVARKDASAEVLVVEKRTYVRGDPELLVEAGLVPARDARRIADLGTRWVVGRLGYFRPLCSMDELLNTVVAQDWVEEKDGSEVEVAGTREIDGQQVVKLTSDQDGTRGRLFVTAGDPHQVLRMVSRGPGGARTITFTEYDIPVGTQPPEKSDVLQLDEDRGKAHVRR